MPMNVQDARIVDPVLTQVARGYMNEMLAWPHLFPIVTVAQRGGKVVEFGAEDFLELDIDRAPGADRAQMHFGHSSQSYAIVQRAIDGKVPKEVLEEAAAVPGIDYSRAAVQKTMRAVSLQVEITAAELATKAASYAADHKSDLAGDTQWSSDNSTPAKAVETAKETIAEGIGREPTVLILSQSVYRALVNHSNVIDRIKHTEGLTGTSAPMVNAMKLAQYFDVEKVVVARARKGKPGTFKSIWGKHAILAYSDISSVASLGNPSFGYTYRLNGYPLVGEGWFDKSCDSWRYPVTCEDAPVIAGKAAGYLFRTVVT